MDSTTGPAVRRAVVADATLDRALADYLIADGRVEVPQSLDWDNELIALMTTARRQLMFSASTFLMGEDHVPVFLITRDDLAAVAPDEVPRDQPVASRHRRPRGTRPAVRPVSDRTDAWTIPAEDDATIEPVASSTELVLYRGEGEPARRGTVMRWALVAAAAIAVGLLSVAAGIQLLGGQRGETAAGPTGVIPPPRASAPVVPAKPAAAQAALVDKPLRTHIPRAAAPGPRRSARGGHGRPPARVVLPNPIPGLPPIRIP